MERINRNNYETFFVDYYDGKLKDFQIEGLARFLEDNPELQREFELFHKLTIKPDNIVFDDKQFLKKNVTLSNEINDDNFDSFCIAKKEGDLSPKQEKLFDNYLNKNKEKEKEYIIYTGLNLYPSEKDIFAEKNFLKKYLTPQRSGKIVYLTLSAAASVLLLLGAFFYLNIRNNSSSTNDQNIVENVNNEVSPQENKQGLTEKKKQKEFYSESNNRKERKNVKTNDEKIEKAHNPKQKEIKINDTRENSNIEMFKGRTTSLLSTNNKLIPNTIPKTIELRDYNNLDETYKNENITVYKTLFNDIRLKIYSLGSSETRITGWDIANLGIRALNQIAGTDMEVEKKLDKDNDIRAFSIKTKLFEKRTRDNKAK